MAKGGKRPGAGRPKGSGLNLKSYLTEMDIKTFIEFLLANYMEDARLMMWMGDHIFGKAPQPITGNEGGPLQIEISEAIAKKHGSHTGAK